MSGSLFDHVYRSVIGVDGEEWAEEQKQQARRLKDPAGFLLYEAIRRAKLLAAHHSQQLELSLAKESKTLEDYGREAHAVWTESVVDQIVVGLPEVPEASTRFSIFQQCLALSATTLAVDRDSLDRLTSGRQGAKHQAEKHRRRVITVAVLGKTWAGAFR